MARRIDAAAGALARLRARVWEKHGRHRVYLKPRGKDITAYFDFDEDAAVEEIGESTDDLLDGAALKVFTDVESSGPKWAINRRKQVKHGIMLDCVELGLVSEVCATWQEVIL